MWPIVRPRPWNLTPEPGTAVLIDPVAVASEAARELRKVGWAGISLMDSDFQMMLLDAQAGTVELLVEQWFAGHREQVCDVLSCSAAIWMGKQRQSGWESGVAMLA
jgi:hypothetical protein